MRIGARDGLLMRLKRTTIKDKKGRREKEADKNSERIVSHLTPYPIQIMNDTYKKPNIKDCCHVPGRFNDLENLSEG